MTARIRANGPRLFDKANTTVNFPLWENSQAFQICTLRVCRAVRHFSSSHSPQNVFNRQGISGLLANQYLRIPFQCLGLKPQCLPMTQIVSTASARKPWRAWPIDLDFDHTISQGVLSRARPPCGSPWYSGSPPCKKHIRHRGSNYTFKNSNRLQLTAELVCPNAAFSNAQICAWLYQT